MGFLPGFREDCGYTYQPKNCDVPVGILDNNFRDPDIERYKQKFKKYEPDVAVLGDAYTEEDAKKLVGAADELLSQGYSFKPVVVPKCRCFEIIPDDFVLGYPHEKGHSDVDPMSYSNLEDWRGRKIHILGGQPEDHVEKIDELTRNLLTGHPPADIVGCDGNSIAKTAMSFFKYWAEPEFRNRWRHAGTKTSNRNLVRKSLKNIKKLFKKHDIWPDETPVEKYGEPTKVPETNHFGDGTSIEIMNREQFEEKAWDEEEERFDSGWDCILPIEEAYIGEYEDHTVAFKSELAKKRHEYYMGVGDFKVE